MTLFIESKVKTTGFLGRTECNDETKMTKVRETSKADNISFIFEDWTASHSQDMILYFTSGDSLSFMPVISPVLRRFIFRAFVSQIRFQEFVRPIVLLTKSQIEMEILEDEERRRWEAKKQVPRDTCDCHD